MMTTKEDKDFEDQIERMKLKNQQILEKFRASEEDRQWAESSGSVISKGQSVKIRAKIMNDPPKLRISQGPRQRPKSVHGNIYDDEQYTNDSNDHFKENRRGNRFRNHDKMVYNDFMNFQQSYNGNNGYNKKSNGFNRQNSYNDDGKSSNYSFIQQIEKKYFGGNQRKNSAYNNNDSSYTLNARFSKSNQRLNNNNYDSNSFNNSDYNQRNYSNNYNNNGSNNRSGRNRKKSKGRNNNNTNNNNNSNNNNNNSNNNNYNNNKNQNPNNNNNNNNENKNDLTNPQNSESNGNKNTKKANGYKSKPTKTNASLVFDDEYFDDTLDDLDQYKLKIDMEDFIVIDPCSKDPILIKPLKPWTSDDHLNNEIGGSNNYNHFNDGHLEKDDLSVNLSTVAERAKDYLSLGNNINTDHLHSDSEEINAKSPLPDNDTATVPIVLDKTSSNQDTGNNELESHQERLPESKEEKSSEETKCSTESATMEDNGDSVKVEEADTEAKPEEVTE